MFSSEAIHGMFCPDFTQPFAMIIPSMPQAHFVFGRSRFIVRVAAIRHFTVMFDELAAHIFTAHAWGFDGVVVPSVSG